MNARHTCNSPEWYTPTYIVEAARQALGAIDLDPLTCAEANATVRAARIYTAEEDGFSQPWAGRVFVNSPGGRGPDKQSLVTRAWRQLMTSPDVTAAIWVGYSLEQLQTLQATPWSPLLYPICVPRKRIAFVPGRGQRAASPSHANYITYLGPDPARFAAAFAAIGAVRL